jgi:hypothetical protein
MFRGAFVGLIALVALSLDATAASNGTVSTYLADGWDIKGVTQLSTTGRTQIIMQKGTRGVVCTIYYSVTENGWTPQGCDPLP